VVVLIPAYEPDDKLIDLVRRLGHHPVVVVDDGSGPAYAVVFAAVRNLGGQVLTLDRNRGKGYALKAGFAHVGDRFPGQDVVCADSDGQHRAQDIDAVAARLAATDAAMVLGARRFTGGVPARSRFGNTATRTVFRLVTGLALDDTQTGLRGYPARMLGWLGQVEGDRFEYELRLLLRAARDELPVEQVEIATIYLAGNATSHFRPVRDSVRIYAPLLAFTASSLLAFAVDAVMLLTLVALTGNLVASALGARLISATVNYTVNRTWVFGRRHRSVPRRRSVRRYAALAVALLAANVVLLQALTMAGSSLPAAKVATDVVLFLAGFLVQRRLVFTRGTNPVPVAVPAPGPAGAERVSHP
jgi:putative flippase GtrA